MVSNPVYVPWWKPLSSIPVNIEPFTARKPEKNQPPRRRHESRDEETHTSRERILQ
jgi:hypothetical protein